MAETPEEPKPPKSPLEAFKILASTVEVENAGEVFEFRLPSVLDEIKLGGMAKRVRREADPESAGYGGDFDETEQLSYMVAKAVALFVVCLVKTSAKWVYAADAAGKPVMAWQSWPPEVFQRVMEIAMAAQAAIVEFRNGGDSRGSAKPSVGG